MSDYICLDVLEKLIQLVGFKQATKLSLLCREWSRDFIWSCIRSIRISIDGKRGNVSATELSSLAGGANQLKSVRSVEVSLFPNGTTTKEMWIRSTLFHGVNGSCRDVISLLQQLGPQLNTLIVCHKFNDTSGYYLAKVVGFVDPDRIQVLRVKGACLGDLADAGQTKTTGGRGTNFFPNLTELELQHASGYYEKELVPWIAGRTCSLRKLTLTFDRAKTSLGYKCGKLSALIDANPGLEEVDLRNGRHTSSRRDAFDSLVGRIALEPARWDNLQGIFLKNTGLDLSQLRFSGKTVWDLCIRNARIEDIFIHSDASSRLLRSCYSDEERSTKMRHILSDLEFRAARWSAPALSTWAKDELAKLEREEAEEAERKKQSPKLSQD